MPEFCDGKGGVMLDGMMVQFPGKFQAFGELYGDANRYL
jgi:hypothetical protein